MENAHLLTADTNNTYTQHYQGQADSDVSARHKNLLTSADEPNKSWEAFLDEWLRITRKYCRDDYQKAQW